jgi:hypothetical protein
LDSVDGKPCLEQRPWPWVRVRTTLHPQGLVIQVARPFAERVGAVGYERLVLDPAEVSVLRRELVWVAIVLIVGGVASTLSITHSVVSPLAAPGLLGAGVLALLASVIAPRRMTVFLDREQALHPSFLRGGACEPDVASFVDDVRRAIITWRCSPPVSDEGEQPAAAPTGPTLADHLDALRGMREDGLLNDEEWERFRKLAERR